MSKGRGKKIAIKFNKALLGGVAGNENAFTISGLEKSPLFYGQPTLRQYAVEKVERYPIAELWRDDFGGTLDGVEVVENGVVLFKPEMGITDAKAYETASGTTLTGTVNAEAGDFVLATVSIRDGNPTPVPAGWTKIYETYTSHPDSDQRLAFFCKEVETAGSVSFTATQPSANRLYMNLISVSGVDGFEAMPGMTVVRTTEEGEFSVPDKAPGAALIWGCVAYLWATSAPYGDWQTTPDDLIRISLPQATTAPRLANFIDLGQGAASRTMQANPKSGASAGKYAAVSAAKLINQYPGSGTYTTSIATIPDNPRLRYEADTPDDTSITVEYSCGETPGTWTPAEDGDLLTITGKLWLRYTLSTTDPTVTPTLLSAWLEEAEAPPDTILLTMTEAGLFRDVEGQLTVAYNQAQGNLKGTRPVASFEASFLPADLEPTPVHEHTITARGEPTVNFIPVAYHYYPDNTRHAISVTAGAILVEFIHVDDIVT